MSQLLSDIRVLDLGQVYQVPYCGLLLGYLGAEVIKVEPPGGENIRTRSEDLKPPQVQMLNANKKGIEINLKKEEGKDIFLDLVEEADVLIENFRPSVMEGLELGYDDLIERNPQLIYAHGSGYGDNGPYANYPAMDLTIQAISGIISSTGFPDQPPVKAGPAIADFLGGTHLLAGVVSALYHRELTGEGQYIDVGMLDCIFPTHTSALASIVEGEDIPKRTGNRHSGHAISPYNSYSTSDGYVVIICVTESQWESLRHHLPDPNGRLSSIKLDSKPKRARHIDTIDEVVEKWTKGQTTEQLLSVLRESDIPCAPVNDLDELLDDPQLEHRNMIHNLPGSGAGQDTIPVPGMPIKLSGNHIGEIDQAPNLGEHTDSVLAGVLNYSEQQIEQLRTNGVI